MKKLTQKMRRGLLLVLSIVMMVPAIAGFAATPQKNAMNAYKKWLSTSKVNVLPRGSKYFSFSSDEEYQIYYGTAASKVKFAIAYINNDNIPELIVQDGQHHFGVLTYKNGKVTRLCSDNVWSDVTKYYKKKSIFVSQTMPNLYPATIRFYYMHPSQTFSKFEEIIFRNGDKEFNELFMSGRHKAINIKTFRSRMAVYTKKIAPTKVVYYSNTKANRNKILK